ncbi:hypothetical protein MSIBF_A1540014 [groundwater metagenome]|uniref:Uncharacterized protein n=1 Tax=groundwater metagenome TaxID=717931 RepID=A0A098E7X3_9ZZZZ
MINATAINKEWDFVTKEIHASNERGAEKRTMLFEFQILLSAVSRVNNKENLYFKVINNDYLLSTGSWF